MTSLMEQMFRDNTSIIDCKRDTIFSLLFMHIFKNGFIIEERKHHYHTTLTTHTHNINDLQNPYVEIEN